MIPIFVSEFRHEKACLGDQTTGFRLQLLHVSLQTLLRSNNNKFFIVRTLITWV